MIKPPTDTGPLSEGHERAEDAVEGLGAMLDGETSLQLQSAFVVHHSVDSSTTPNSF